MDAPGAVQGKSDIFQHLTGAHFKNNECIDLFRKMFNHLGRVGPKGNGANQSNLDAHLPAALDGAFCNPGGGAISHDQQIGVIGFKGFIADLFFRDDLIFSI